MDWVEQSRKRSQTERGKCESAISSVKMCGLCELSNGCSGLWPGRIGKEMVILKQQKSDLRRGACLLHEVQVVGRIH